ncbi:MAG: hydantoinase/oxoprolinase family protein [Betaproteobacteria bacterium]|nr:hydantoinase/oxoprolinase family protein [Betaproteobacteria bacterium]
MTKSVSVAIDTGGTFTDLVMFDADNGAVRYTKALTTADPIEGILECVAKAGVDIGKAVLFKHGTTLVINTLLERSGPVIGLVTTRGFRDILELGRGNRTEAFNLFFRRDPPLVPRERRFEIEERVDGNGRIQCAPRREEVAAVAAKLRAAGVAAVGVSFLNAYLEPGNERLVSGWLREMMPECYVTAGSDLTREWYEYERTCTAAANAYAGPKVNGYITALDLALKARGFEGQFLMMGSNGGVLSVQHATATPILLVESGPVGGCIGAGAYGKALGFGNLIAFDMGGTTAKCAVIRDGEFGIESTYYAGGYGRGIPVRARVVDIVEVGAGGGSIAWIDEQKQLNVGPKSAGSSPGPVAYGRGGNQITVTDANLFLGRLDPLGFQGGEMKLDVAATRTALSDRLARPLGYQGEPGLLELASGILAIAAVKMSEAIKRITVQRGEDPRDFVLFAYGGGGPMHACELARELSIPVVVIPPEAGNFSAIGMLLADIRRDESRTFLRRLTQEAVADITAAFDEMESALRKSVAEDFGAVPVACERAMEVRFVGQYHTVRIVLATSDVEALRRTFLDIYRTRYGHAIERTPLEAVSLHCTARATTRQPDIARLAGELPLEAPATPPKRPVFFTGHGRIATQVFSRRALPIGFQGQGPAVIEEYGSTTLIAPADSFHIGPLGEIRIAINQLAQAPGAESGAAAVAKALHAA